MSKENRRSCRQSTSSVDRLPIPGQQLIEPVDGVIVDAGEYVGEPGLRVDVVELRRHDQRRHDSGAVGAAFGAGEQPRFSPQCKSPQRAFGGIVGQADTPVVEKARKVIPALEHVIDWLCNGCRARQVRPLLAQPHFQSLHKGHAVLLSDAQTLIGGKAIMPRSMSNSASMCLTASSATGEIAAAPLRHRAFAAISASSRNCLLAWAQHSADVIGPGARDGSYSLL